MYAMNADKDLTKLRKEIVKPFATSRTVLHVKMRINALNVRQDMSQGIMQLSALMLRPKS